MSVVELVGSICSTDLSLADTTMVSRVLDQWRQVQNWGASIELACARRLGELAAVDVGLVPEQVLADAGRVSVGESTRRLQRVKTTDAVPELGSLLEAGETSGAHVDAVTAALRGLKPVEKQRFTEHGAELAKAAGELSADEFAKVVRRHRDQVCRDGGLSRLVQQKRNTRLRTWVDRNTGMYRLSGEYDPETGMQLAAQLRAKTDALFHQQIPALAPSDPQERQHYLAALALVELVNGNGAGKTSTELMILIDAETLCEGEHDGTIVDVGFDLDLPVETIRQRACCAEVVVPVVTAANRVNLHLGRAQRLPNRAQRRALKAMYKTCPVPGCRVQFDKLKIHHLRWWTRHHGLTDLENLLPLCCVHHDAIHTGDLTITMTDNRSLTLLWRNGNQQTTGPPSRTRRVA